jgi:hypothetical protein
MATLLTIGSAAAAPTQREKPPTSRAPAKPATATPSRPAATAGKLSPVQQALRRNPNLAERIAARLPARIDVYWASSGFRNLGQFVAAVNAAHHLKIPFMTLKSRLLDDRMSLGQAIRDLRPEADYRKETRRS